MDFSNRRPVDGFQINSLAMDFKSTSCRWISNRWPIDGSQRNRLLMDFKSMGCRWISNRCAVDGFQIDRPSMDFKSVACGPEPEPTQAPPGRNREDQRPDAGASKAPASSASTDGSERQSLGERSMSLSRACYSFRYAVASAALWLPLCYSFRHAIASAVL